ncbi:DUF1501 domain-containing protein [Roseococcus thiosulfatophilus]|uniref:DUF1501 domain-containing protein n=1 Tax=Roseococcus thiosulfatophilus TaxID=35813 RepID=UPI001A8DACDF|nr:DUF1501 domain-containing protein [Roseococcus thiosulfatophilus]
MRHLIGRRGALAGLGSLFAWSYAPRISSAAGARDPRLLVVVLRGGLDGLSAVVPLGDPAYAERRTGSEMAQAGATLPLDNMFGLNRNMPALAEMYRAREALILHAVATPYRERSHFDAQDLLESGFPSLVRGERTGWLNRTLQQLPRGERLPPPRGLAISPMVPLIMSGAAPVETWQRQTFRYADDDTIARLLDLYEARDPVLAEALRRGAALDGVMQADPEAMGAPAARQAGLPDFTTDAAAAARIMARPDGPRVAAISYGGWDTHNNQGPVQGQLGRGLAALDAALGALRAGLLPVWRDTVVAVVTEFGRTVRVNGSLGTDHGVGTVALLLGGAVRGGRVLADWPGLAEHQLYERRDLMPTTDLRAVMKGMLAEHLGLEPRLLGRDTFPGSEALRPLQGLVG